MTKNDRRNLNRETCVDREIRRDDLLDCRPVRVVGEWPERTRLFCPCLTSLDRRCPCREWLEEWIRVELNRERNVDATIRRTQRTFGRMFESTISDRTEKLRLEKEILETTGMKRHVGASNGCTGLR